MDKKLKELELQRIISLTFDENPEVRKQAALKLAENNEPAAIFALLELSYDKNESVKDLAKNILSKIQPTKNDSISFAEIFGRPEKKEEPIIVSPEDNLKKRKLLTPIEQIFDKKLGKKSRLVKERMMSTIEKIYLKAVDTKSEDVQKREKSMQRMLTSYADVLSGLDKLMFDEQKESEAEKKVAEVRTMDIQKSQKEIQTSKKTMLEEIGSDMDSSKIKTDLAVLEMYEDETIEEDKKKNKEDKEEYEITEEKSIFRKAYDIMMACDGDDEVMLQQAQKFIKQLEDEVKLAFKMAKQRFKAENITHLTEIRNGMRNINTDILIVKAIDRGEYSKTKTKKDIYTRIIANDAEGSEGVIYLFEGRGSEVRSGMKIKIAKGQVKTFSFSGETAITIGKKGNVYIVL
ncbi:MAG: HEAT repeat domain-containing protein [Candidatus Micrarchaeota archaeon]